MKLDSLKQLQTLNEMMKDQFAAYPVSRVMILGLAGGNGLEHIAKERFERVYGVDVNAAYLEEAARRYPSLAGVLECLAVDLREKPCRLPEAELVVANLLIEYIGCTCFQKVIRRVRPSFVSCVIQRNEEAGWVSDSPYLRVFDVLEQLHRQVEAAELEAAMFEIGYRAAGTLERGLPNGKKFLRMDFERRLPA